MKNLRNWRILLLLFLAFATVQSCTKDDPVIVQDALVEEKPSTDGTDETGDVDNGNTDNTDVETEEGFDEITLYRVDGDNLVREKDFDVSGKQLELQKDLTKHQEVWDLVKKIIPPSYRTKMGEFMIFAGEDNGVAGYVFEIKDDLSEWQMGIAIDFAYEGGFNANGELAYTIIHEFAHILTLNNTQVDTTISDNECQSFYTGEGCAKNESYINKLYSKFWADIYEEFLALGDSEEEYENFYSKYQDRFVTGYASTNPGEDIAEVFATFVTRNGGVNGSSIAEQKIQLMYEHPELVTLRDYIRGNTASAKVRSFLPAAGAWKKANTFGNPKKIHCSKPTK